jgi:hypothetical protein
MYRVKMNDTHKMLSNLHWEDKINKIFKNVNDTHGDSGSCVLGYEILLNGVKLCNQPWQGSVSCDIFYSKVKDYLIEQGVRPEDISINYGRMD